MKFRRDKGLPLLAGHIIKNKAHNKEHSTFAKCLTDGYHGKKKKNQQPQQQSITIRPSEEAVTRTRVKLSSTLYGPLFTAPYSGKGLPLRACPTT
jgi:hypothetical protein